MNVTSNDRIDSATIGQSVRVVQAARHAWATELGRYQIHASKLEMRSFYTALYHTMMSPSIYDDVDGRYCGPDHSIHQTKSGHHYDTFPLWDTFRALHPLLILSHPERVKDMSNSLLDFAEASPYKMLPIWSFHGNETFCMIGYHAVSVLADAVIKGVQGIDAKRALRLARQSAENPAYAGLD